MQNSIKNMIKSANKMDVLEECLERMRVFLNKVKSDNNYYNPQKIFVESSGLSKYIKFNVITVRYFCKKYLKAANRNIYDED